MKRQSPLFIVLFLAMAACIGFLLGKSEEAIAPRMRIGVPDDSGGLPVHYLLRGGRFPGAAAASAYKTFPMRDCCAAISEWAFSADEVDMAVMCPDAAARLTEKDPRFEVVGPCVLNSDVIIIHPGRRPGRIGIAQKRRTQERLVAGAFGPDCAAVPMLPAALLYAYERGAADGVVIDVLKGAAVRGERVFARSSEADSVTYVLAVKRSLKSDPLYSAFMDAWSRAVEELGKMDVLAREIQLYKGVRWTDREIQEWKDLRTRFVFPGKRN